MFNLDDYKKFTAELVAKALEANKGKNVLVAPYVAYAKAGNEIDEDTDKALRGCDFFKTAEEDGACTASFIGEWNRIFDPQDIWKEDFTSDNGTISSVSMLHGAVHGFVETKDFNGFVKHYKNNDYCLMALQPKKRDRLNAALVETDLGALFDSRKHENCRVALPQFELEFEDTLADGTTCKSVFKVDNAGKKGSTAQTMMYTGIMSSIDRTVKLTGPFAFAILHRDTNIPIFVGVINRI